MVRRCFLCKLKKNYKTLSLQCCVCDDFYHRTCLDVSLENFRTVRDSWECDKCVNSFSSSQCLQCGDSEVYTKKKSRREVSTDWYCMNCLFPPMSVHEVFSIGCDVDQVSMGDGFVQDMPSFQKGLKMGHLNIRKLDKYIDQLRIILKTYRFDIFACSETFLDGSVQDGFISVDSYRMLRFDREREGGGLIIYISEKYLSSVVECTINLPLDVEMLSVKFWLPNVKPMIFTVVYKPPHVKVEEFSDSFDSLINNLESEANELFFLGDFNIDLSKKTSPVNRFKFLTRSHGLVQMIKTDTRVNNRSASLIDHVYVNRNDNIIQSGIISVGISDHELIYCIRKINRQKFLPKVVNTRNYKNVDWEQVNEDILNSPIDQIGMAVSADDKLDAFNQLVLDALDEHAPRLKLRVKGKPAPWLTADIRKCMHRRDHLRKEFRISRRQSTWDEYKNIRNKVNNKIRFSKCEYFKSSFDKDISSKSLWSVYSKLTGNKAKKDCNITSLIENGVSHTSNPDICSLLQKSFLVNTVDYSRGIGKFQDLNRKEAKDRPFIQVTNDEVFSAIQSLKNRSSSTITEIPCVLFKKCLSIVDLLSVLISHFFLIGEFPTKLKLARVTPIYKGKGKKSDRNSYRPISTLPIVGKIIEKILYKRLLQEVDKSVGLSANQHGFRKGRSTQSALLAFTDFIYKGIDNRKGKVGAVFVDLRKAFDSVPILPLLKKLKNRYNLSPYLLAILSDYFINRKMIINLANYSSDAFNIFCGVPQGSILGPLLFILYIDDISKIMNGIPYILYADDLVFYLEGVDAEEILRRLQEVLKRMDDWFKTQELDINYSKTNFMIFHKSNDNSINDINLVLSCNGKLITRVYEFKYLGIFLDCHLSFKKHYEYVSNKVSSAIGIISRMKRFVTERMLRLLVDSYIHSIIDYCLVVWAVRPSTEYVVLQKRIDHLFDSIPSSQDLQADFFTIEERMKYNVLVNTYKSLKGLYFDILPNIFQFVDRGRNSILLHTLQVPIIKSESIRRSFLYRGVSFWNAMPYDVRSRFSDLGIVQFKSRIEAMIMNQRVK